MIRINPHRCLLKPEDYRHNVIHIHIKPVLQALLKHTKIHVIDEQKLVILPFDFLSKSKRKFSTSSILTPLECICNNTKLSYDRY